jgi:hypothetical protein
MNMQIQIDFWQLLGIAGAIIAAIVAMIGWFIMQLKDQFQSSLSAKFETMQSSISQINEESKQWMRVERELLELKAELPVHYVRREDYVRNQTVIEAKLDAVALKLENKELRGRNEH